MTKLNITIRIFRFEWNSLWADSVQFSTQGKFSQQMSTILGRLSRQTFCNFNTCLSCHVHLKRKAVKFCILLAGILDVPWPTAFLAISTSEATRISALELKIKEKQTGRRHRTFASKCSSWFFCWEFVLEPQGVIFLQTFIFLELYSVSSIFSIQRRDRPWEDVGS